MGSSKQAEQPNRLGISCVFRRFRRSLDKCQGTGTYLKIVRKCIQVLLLIIIFLLCKIITDVQDQNTKKLEDITSKRHVINNEIVVPFAGR